MDRHRSGRIDQNLETRNQNVELASEEDSRGLRTQHALLDRAAQVET
jgi:hypothetical protein